jgi:hypothetical protein
VSVTKRSQNTVDLFILDGGVNDQKTVQ